MRGHKPPSRWAVALPGMAADIRFLASLPCCATISSHQQLWEAGGVWGVEEHWGRGQTQTPWRELTVLISSASPSLNSTPPQQTQSFRCVYGQDGTQRVQHHKISTTKHSGCHPKCLKIQYLDSYYSVYYFCIGTHVWKAPHDEPCENADGRWASSEHRRKPWCVF